MADILLIDSDPDAERLGRALAERPETTCAGPVGTLADAVRMLGQDRPDVVVLAEAMPGVDGLEGARLVHALAPEADLVLLVDDLDPHQLQSALGAGVRALTRRRSAAEVIDLVRSAPAGVAVVEASTAVELVSRAGAPPPPDTGEWALTPRELEVLELLGHGLDPKTIAHRLTISVHTARGHVKSILGKLGAHSQLEAVVLATRSGLLRDRAS